MRLTAHPLGFGNARLRVRQPRPNCRRLILVDEGQQWVESRCGAVAVGRACLFPPPFVWRCLSGSTMAIIAFFPDS
jgi:hypothetical protein